MAQRLKCLPPMRETQAGSLGREDLLEKEMVTHPAGDPGWIPGSGRSPGEGNGNPLQYSCLENPMDGEAW